MSTSPMCMHHSHRQSILEVSLPLFSAGINNADVLDCKHYCTLHRENIYPEH
jgi:hypothetical protein